MGDGGWGGGGWGWGCQVGSMGRHGKSQKAEECQIVAKGEGRDFEGFCFLICGFWG